MRTSRFISAIAICLAAYSPVAFAADCTTAQQQQFLSFNSPLWPKSETEEASYSSSRKADKVVILHDYVDGQIIALLEEAPKIDTASIEAWLRCLQSLVPEYSGGEKSGGTNVPKVLSLTNQSGDSVAVAYSLLGGFEAVPDVWSYLEIFKKSDGQWMKVAEAGEGFPGTFFVYPLTSGQQGETWFLLSGGSHFGSTQGKLHLQVLAYDGNSFRTVWERSGIPGDLTQVLSDRFTLTEELKGVEFTKTFKVSSKGITEAAK